ncbi:MAG: tRNA dihydrouridine synthase DusB [Gammaproteobacteria bacterium]|nr:tRNA dihydrouridine synthase DusB [Gammaproteobacteria bacterium]
MVVGPYKVRNNLFLAPLVGISDVPFREICSEQGAGLTIGEMLTCNTDLWNNERNRFKQIKSRINAHQVVQIVGSDPGMMANAAQLNVAMGATAIDINMGCPAKKVLKKAAGSALLKNPSLVARILRAVVLQVNVPVTLKIRTGWCPATRNGVEIAKIAEDCGIQLLSVHGRTRECRFKGKAEYDTIAAIKQAVSIPIIANGDIHCPDKAKQVLQYTKADGLMIGRAAQGQPWLFKQIEHLLATGKTLPTLTLYQKLKIIESHLKKLHSFYGEVKGVWYARKHVASYVKNLPQGRVFLANFNKIESGLYQLETVNSYFGYLTGDERVIAA